MHNRGAAVIVGSSRQTYAFARDGAMPFSKWLTKLTDHKVPAHAVWFNIAFAAILGIPYLFSDVAFETIVSINTIAASISYFIPIWLRITMARGRFQKGPFNLGRFSIPCGKVDRFYFIIYKTKNIYNRYPCLYLDIFYFYFIHFTYCKYMNL